MPVFMQFESLKSTHAKEVMRLQRTLEDKFQMELAQKVTQICEFIAEMTGVNDFWPQMV